ncbi:MAG: PASTA domain-containing protein [Bacteroidetes bacterium]|nr:MAG: PASTA domain-containing protein [Bacteroidota bacterium]
MVYNEPVPSAAPRGISDHSKKIRLRILLVFFMVLFLAVVYHLVKLQVLQSEEYKEKAKKQYESKVELAAVRGSICDRTGQPMASNTMLYSYAADPKCLNDSLEKRIVDVFAKAFGIPRKYYAKKMKPNSHYVWLARLVDPDTLRCKIPDKMAGLTVFKEPKRLYHHKTVAGQLLGTTDIDNKGIMGLELSLNKKLSGAPGFIIMQKDGLGGERPEIEYPRVEPQNGNTIHLTIDLALQFIAEDELRIGVEKNNAESGLVIMMDPKTGEILTVAQYPSLDPRNPSSCSQKDQKLKLITDRIEPGSVFKIVTASAALEDHLVTPDQLFFAENGKWVVPIGRGRVRKIVDDHPHGMVTVQEAMEVSSNIVMAKISNIVGAERFYKMARAYGFGSPTTVELPGEIRGVLKKPNNWSRTTLNTMAFGYEVGVTPLQLVCAYSVVANGGYLMRPYIVKKELDANGMVVSETYPQTIRKVISPATLKVLSAMFEGVVDSGTATAVQIQGLRIAGKTGTAKRNINGHYEPGKYTASFVGFYPVEDPKIVCLVMLDNPKGGSYYGGLTSGPVFKAIAERIMTTTDILGPIAQPQPVFASDPLRQSQQQAQNTTPVDDTMVIQPQEKYSPEERVVPNVQGYSKRKAMSLLSHGQLDVVVDGIGVVISQEPAAGTVVHPRTKVFLRCEPKTLSAQGQGLD